MKKLIIYSLLPFLFAINAMGQEVGIDASTIIIKVTDKGRLKSTQEISQQLSNDLSPFEAKAQVMFQKHASLKKGETAHEIHKLYKVRLSDIKQYSSCLNYLNKKDYIAYAEPLRIPHILDTVNDPFLANQYHLPLIEIVRAHEIEQGDTNIVIGVIDTGIDMDHEDLVENIKINYLDPINGIDDDQDGYIDNYRGWDIANNDPNPECTDSTYHGAYVSGIASASTNNAIGIASPGYNCKFLPIKAANNAGQLIAAYEGVVYAADHGCQIINCSWGDTVLSLYAQDIIDYAVNYRGCVVVAAAGNAKNDTPYYPASLDGVISVGATSYGDVKWGNSTFGIELDLVAPGKNIYTTGYNNSYKSAYGGTSYAAPLVAGVAALLLANQPELNARQIAEKIRINTDVIDTIYENQYYHRLLGHGRLNAYKALSDDSLPGLRIINHELKSNNSSLISSKDSCSFYINVFNHLEKALSTSVLFSTNSAYTTIVNDLHRMGDIAKQDSANNYLDPFKLVFSEDTPFDHQFVVSYDFVGNGFSDYQQFKVMTNRSFYNVQANLVHTSFTSNGNWGYTNRDERIGTGFIFNNQQLLNTGGIICGKSTTEMVSSMDNGMGFDITSVIDTTQHLDSTLGFTSFSPNKDKWDINIAVNQNYRTYTEEAHEATIYSTYEIINQGETIIDDYHFSLFTDWDIHNARANKAVYDESLNMVYTYSYSNIINYAGVCLLNDIETTPYCFDLVEGGNGGLDITNDFSDEKKWFAMNNARLSSGNNSYSMNVASMLSCGPFIIESGDTIKLTYALIAASNLEDLKSKARAAKLKFTPPSTHIINKNQYLNIYPNPANDRISIQSSLGNPKQIILFDSQGRIIKEWVNKNDLRTSSIPTGAYYLQISYEDLDFVEKIMITH